MIKVISFTISVAVASVLREGLAAGRLDGALILWMGRVQMAAVLVLVLAAGFLRWIGLALIPEALVFPLQTLSLVPVIQHDAHRPRLHASVSCLIFVFQKI